MDAVVCVRAVFSEGACEEVEHVERAPGEALLEVAALYHRDRGAVNRGHARWPPPSHG